jgi:hypothetical protein
LRIIDLWLHPVISRPTIKKMGKYQMDFMLSLPIEVRRIRRFGAPEKERGILLDHPCELIQVFDALLHRFERMIKIAAAFGQGSIHVDEDAVCVPDCDVQILNQIDQLRSFQGVRDFD